jgi:hypothetical protein
MLGVGLEAYPQYLRIVAGNPNATGPQDTDVVGWVCRQAGGTPVGPFTSPSVANCETRVPDNRGLSLHVDFPTCWDGQLANHNVDGNTANADGPGPAVDHVVYPNGYPSRTATCPASHPKKLSHLRLDVKFRCGSTSGWKCESNLVTLSSGSQDTVHAGFLNRWTPAGMSDLLSCVNVTTNHPHGSTGRCGT